MLSMWIDQLRSRGQQAQALTFSSWWLLVPEIPVIESEDAPLTTKVCWCFVKYNCTARSQSEDANEAVSAFPEVFGGEQHQRPSWSQIIKCILLWLCSPVTCSKKQSCQMKLPGNQGIFEICLMNPICIGTARIIFKQTVEWESRRWNEGGPTQLTSTLGLVGLPIAWGVPPFWTLPRMHAKGETNILNYNTIIIRNNYNNYYNNDYNHKLHSKIIHFVSPIDKALSWNISMYPAFLSKCVAMELPLTIADSGRSPPSIIR